MENNSKTTTAILDFLKDFEGTTILTGKADGK